MWSGADKSHFTINWRCVIIRTSLSHTHTRTPQYSLKMLHMPLLFTSLLPFSWERWTAAYYRSPQRKFLCRVSFHHLNRIWQMCVKPGSYGEYHLNDNTVVSELIYTDFTMTPLSMVLVWEDISASPLFSNFQTSFSYHCFWQRILPQWLHFLFRSDIVQTTQSHINPSQFSHRTVKKKLLFIPL